MEEASTADEGRGGPMPEYEQQRLSRIRVNRSRLEALGIPVIASSLFSPPPPSKRQERREEATKGAARGRAVGDEDDDDYLPSDADQGDGREGGGESSSLGEEEEEEQAEKKTSSVSRGKGKKRSSSKAAEVMKKGKTEPNNLTDNDTALKQAIALSLGEHMDPNEAVGGIPQNSGSSVADFGPYRKDKSSTHGPAGKRKSKIVNKSRVQLTEDEVDAYFFSFDVGKGYITQQDLQKMAIAHDFSWTKSEIFNMIHCFDGDGDGKLSLKDFRAIVGRCRMIKDAAQH
ncbi:hypothetical protein MUK42_20159 [Musa troglodytarum]|uniref:EF-hand domain-containing protein n=1 Tax=Musa troglodytarum TaxID=320322 RepID=A0A9E7FYH3_9LILI|nr:hypothetical protein MUK42_20159 [Musa troglodytarum]